MLLITLAALGIAVLVAWNLNRAVVGPLRQLPRGANAIRRGDFNERIDVTSRDELGELALTFNQMADDLSEFRRTNIGEVASFDDASAGQDKTVTATGFALTGADAGNYTIVPNPLQGACP